MRVNPKIDIVFKKIFGTEENKDLLKSLVNSIVPEDEQIVEFTLKNPYNEANFVGDKMSVLDIKACDDKERWYDIEIQIKEQEFYGQRALFYFSELYANQLSEGKNYDTLRKTVVISLLNFNYFDDKRYFRRCSFKDFDTNLFYKELDYADLYFIEFQKFDNDLKHIKTMLDRWITFLNRAYELDKDNLPSEMKLKEIEKALKTVDIMSLSSLEREYYQARQKAIRDEYAVIKTAENKALREGMEIGLEQGKEIGKEIGLEQGKEIGKEIGIEQGLMLTAKNAILEGLSNEIITKITRLTDLQIDAIRKQLEN